MSSNRPSRCGGVSLVELIIAIVVITIAGTFFAAALLPAAQSIAADQDLQTATRHAQECAEHIIMRRRVQGAAGWSNVALGSGTTVCSSLTLDSGYSRSVNVVDPNTPTPGTSEACPSATLTDVCKLVQVLVTKGNTTADIRFVLVYY